MSNKLLLQSFQPGSSFITEFGQLTIEKILRIIPGKRLTALVECSAKKFILKIFLKEKHYQRTLYGYDLLKTAGIPTPAIVAHEINLPFYLVISEYLEDSEEVGDSEPIITKLNHLIILLHQQHLIQKDVHLKNFLVQENTIFVLDPDTIAIAQQEKKLLKNYAFFLAQLKHVSETQIQALITDYLTTMHYKPFKQIYDYLLKKRSGYQKKIVYKFLKKIFRNSTQFFSEKKFFYHGYADRSYLDLYYEFTDNPEQFIKTYQYSVLKQGNSSHVFLIHYNDQAFVIKKFCYKSKWIALKRALKKSRAEKNWYFSHYLQWLGILTPSPIAYFEKRFGLFVLSSYFISSYVTGKTLAQFFEQAQPSEQECNDIADQMLQLIETLYQNKITHGDMKSTNYIICDQKIYLIDLDGMKKVNSNSRFKTLFRKDIQRFLANFIEIKSVIDYFKTRLLRFL